MKAFKEYYIGVCYDGTYGSEPQGTTKELVELGWKAALKWVLSEYPSHAWDLNRVVEKELDEELA